MIVIRLAAAADVPALAELRRLSALEQSPERDDEDFEERFASWYERESSRRLTWLAEGDGAAAGMMNVVIFERMPRPGPDPGRWGYLANAYVRPAYRNQGVGTRLVEAILSYADAAGLARVVLSPSQRSIPFYRRAGFGPADALLSREHPAG
jgi:GNAT superfamily N-acetyltransferase